MTFVAPLFLIAGLAAAIPIVLHMINRQKATRRPFPTLRFLNLSVQKTRRRKRVHDVLLMMLRAAVLLLIAAGLARPTMTSLNALWGGDHWAAVVILDNSASMGTIDQDRIRFETAVGAAAQILGQFTEGDQMTLLPTCGPPFPEADKLHRTQEPVRQMLGQCRVSYERADLGLKLRQARKLLDESEAPNRQIYVLTDMQRVSWEGTKDDGESQKAKGEIDSSVPIVIVDCNRTPKPNVAVQGIDLEALLPVAGLPMKATVTLLNASTVAGQRLVELIVDGSRKAVSQELSLPPGGRVKYDFALTFQHGGFHRGEVRLVGADGSKYDDRRFFTIEIDQNIPVAVVRSERHEISYLDDAYYLKRALAPGASDRWAIRPTMLVADDLINESLEKYKVLFCVNLPAPKGDAAERLRAYVAGGGNLVWICGDNIAPEKYDQMNEQAGGQLLPAPLLDVREPSTDGDRDSWYISFFDKTHPALRRLADPPSLHESVLVSKHVRMAVGEESAETSVLARLDDGEPLLVQRNVGRGRVLLLGTSVHVNWSNLPLRPIFLPLMTQLTFYLAEVEQTRRELIAGQPLVIPLADQPQPVAVEIVPPSGETLRLMTKSEGNAAGQTFRDTNTYQIGIYQLRLPDPSSPTRVAYSVNADPTEAEPATIDRQKLQNRFADDPLVFADDPDDLSGTFALLREGKSLWGLFLTAVLIALVFETFVSNRLSPKREEQASSRPPPGMRRLAGKG